MKGATRIFAVFAALFVLSPNCIATELIGTVVPPLPYGIFEDGGVCIGRTQATMCERSNAILKTADGKDFLIYTASEEPHQGKAARWKITDTIPFPKVLKNVEFVWWECRRLGTPDPSIMALVQSSAKREWLPARGWAYRVDFETGKFVRLEPKEIDCANPALDAED